MPTPSPPALPLAGAFGAVWLSRSTLWITLGSAALPSSVHTHGTEEHCCYQCYLCDLFVLPVPVLYVLSVLSICVICVVYVIYLCYLSVLTVLSMLSVISVRC